MKKFYPIQVLITCLVTIISTTVLPAQTFQNTFTPTGSDNYVAGVAVSNDYWVIGNTNSFAPSAGTEHILFSRYTGATGASAWDRKYYDGANTSVSYTATDIQAGYGNLTPSPSVGPMPCTVTACPAIGTTVNAVGIPKSKNYFYVSGYYKDPVFAVRRPLMIKYDNNGNILWVRTNLFAAGNIYDEIGISVESCPNGDMMMVSSVTNPNTGLTFPAITRIDINGVLMWRYFYNPVTFQPLVNFIPRQSCVFREFVNGNVNDPIGIVVTGERTVPGAIGSTHFVMRVRYDGLMIWKMEYPLVAPNGAVTTSAAWDIMFEDEAVGVAGVVDNFVLTGLANAVGIGATPGCLGFLSRVSATTGAFVNAHRFGVIGTTFPPAPVTYGQGIYQSRTSTKNVVITGGVDDPNTGIFSDTYLLEMNITNGKMTNAHHYTLTTPNFPRTESVVSVGSGYPTTGYFISTNASSTATLTDGHVIKTNDFGMVNAATCHSDTLKLSFDTVKSNPIQYCTDQVCDNITQHQLVMKKKTAQHSLCFSPLKLADGMESLPELGEGEVGIYPNPVSNDAAIQVLFTTHDAANYTIKLIDINGRIMENLSRYFEAGDQQVELETSGLPVGIFFISISDGSHSVSAKFIKIK